MEKKYSKLRLLAFRLWLLKMSVFLRFMCLNKNILPPSSWCVWISRRSASKRSPKKNIAIVTHQRSTVDNRWIFAKKNVDFLVNCFYQTSAGVLRRGKISVFASVKVRFSALGELTKARAVFRR